MFLIKKILTPFLIPPGSLVLLSFLLAFLGRKKRLHASSLLIMGLLFWAVSTDPFGHMLLMGLEVPLDPGPLKEGDVIVLLGGGLRDRVPDLGGIGAPSSESTVRTVSAIRLQRLLDLPVIVSGGRVYEEGPPEAGVLKRFLMDMGLQEEMILLEEKSRDTFENLAFVKGICQEKGFRRPILVTSAYHMKRALYLARLQGLQVIPFPCGHRTWEGRRFYWHEYLPDPSGLLDSAWAIREYLGLFFYMIIGQMGVGP